MRTFTYTILILLAVAATTAPPARAQDTADVDLGPAFALAETWDYNQGNPPDVLGDPWSCIEDPGFVPPDSAADYVEIGGQPVDQGEGMSMRPFAETRGSGGVADVTLEQAGPGAVAVNSACCRTRAPGDALTFNGFLLVLFCDGATGCTRVQYIQPITTVWVPPRGTLELEVGELPTGSRRGPIVIAQVVGWGWATNATYYTVTNAGDSIVVP
jgi:hypothetical protein